VRRLLIVVAAAGAVLMPAAPPAGAHDHRPPRVELAVAGKIQRGHFVTETWTRPSGDGLCATWHGDGFWGYPGPLEVSAGEHVVRFRMYKSQRPRLHLTMRRRLEKDGRGGGRDVPFHLRRRMRDGRQIWVAQFRLAVVRHVYLDAVARWRDTEGCGGPQEVYRTYHLASHRAT
jgi:hypothetical protein